ncbi:MAG: threonine ammonia-lyase IlvA [Saprospiraceae bacterium]
MIAMLDNSGVSQAAKRLKDIAHVTPLTLSERYSELSGAEVYFKREDLQVVRSYKIRGAYNKMSSLNEEERARGVICASAGNHAQGVALSCQRLHIKGSIYMPMPTPKQKLDKVKMFGQNAVEVVIVGDTYDDAYQAALLDAERTGSVFVHPFDDEKVIEGQATVGLEILRQCKEPIDYVILPVGGGGLAAGVSQYLAKHSPSTKVIGVEPCGAASMSAAFEEKKVVSLNTIDTFVDGAAVRRVGTHNFPLCQRYLAEMRTVHEGQICQTILDLYNKDAIVIEPAGALSVAALCEAGDTFKGKRVVCILSGSNNDMSRSAEIEERALLHAGLKHYFIINFAQRAGALREFVVEILSPTDNITHFEYTKKSNRVKATAIVGLELSSPKHLAPLIARMKERGFFLDYLNENEPLFRVLV